MTANSNITRRNLLRGLGATLALPWMESLAAAAPGTKLRSHAASLACITPTE